MRIALVISLVLLVSACSWVKLDQGAEDIALVKPTHVQNCTKIGSVYSNTHHRLLGINRGRNKVASELLSLAKNEALSMGADTLVATSESANGEQNFLAYKCANSAL